MTKKQLTEALADIEHRRWNKWTNYQFSLCEELPDGSLRIPAELVQRWRRQAATSYADLSEQEKESDRHQVAPALPIIEAYAGQSEKALSKRLYRLEFVLRAIHQIASNKERNKSGEMSADLTEIAELIDNTLAEPANEPI